MVHGSGLTPLDGILGFVESLLHFAGNFWWLIFPLGGAIGTGVRVVAAANERRAERRLERYRIKQQTKIAGAEASGRARNNEAAYRREMTKVLAQHDRTDARWLDYEIDIAKLLDFPLMTDMRDPLTVSFHKARQRADLLRPETVDDVLPDRDAQLEYRDACMSTWPPSRSPRPRRYAGAAAISRPKGSSGSNARRICCAWPPTARPRRRNAGTPTAGRGRNSTA